jgi:hypothetical protein
LWRIESNAFEQKVRAQRSWVEAMPWVPISRMTTAQVRVLIFVSCAERYARAMVRFSVGKRCASFLT